MSRHFFTLDVFTTRRLSGNPLAVVLNSEGLSDAEMQSIAAEFNLSETVFVLPPDDPANRAKIRIFTPVHELPFAGHPTVGTAVLLSTLDNAEDGASFVLEERVGPVTCFISEDSGISSARFQMPKLPSAYEWDEDIKLLADALGLKKKDIGFGKHKPAVWDAGVPYALVPVRTLEAMQRIVVDPAKAIACEPEVNGFRANIYAYCEGGEEDHSDYHARMFAHSAGIPEDPATGSAAAAFCGQLATLEMKKNETRSFMIEQGYEMGRPSQIFLAITRKDGEVSSATISGSAVEISEGMLRY